MCGLLQCLKSIQVDILCLSKTSLNDRKMERIRFSLGLSNMVVVKGDGRGGGIAMLWRKGVNMILRNYSINIDVVADDGFSWRFTGI